MDDGELAERSKLFDDRVDTQNSEIPGYCDSWNALTTAILGFGGLLVVPPVQPDILSDVITSTGQLFVPNDYKLVEGEASDCHVNASLLWRSKRAESIGTGYALSEDGLWREHSWAWAPTGELLETTVGREKYFGLRMDDAMSEWFADWIAPVD